MGLLSLSLLFLIVAVIAGVFGFTGVASGSKQIAKILAFIFLVLFILSLLFGGTVSL